MERSQNLQIYPGRDKNFEKELKNLKESSISARNKDIISQFHNFMFAKGAKQMRIAKLSGQLRKVCLMLEKDLDKVSKQDIQEVIAQYNQNSRYAEATKSDYRRTIKQFFKWFADEDARLESTNQAELKEAQKLYRYLKDEVSISYKEAALDYSTIITEEDIRAAINKGCRNIKERALLAFLHETGVRAGELLNMRIIDVERQKNYAVARVDGKTGERRVPIVTSLPYITQYLDMHPFKEDKYSYLWLGDNHRHMHTPLLHIGMQKLINRCFERAGIKDKRHNLHWFRHSRATLLAPHLTEVLLCKYMGWTLGSKQVRRYCHLCTAQLETAILGMQGIKEPEKDKLQSQPVTCVCGTINTPDARYCFKCGNPLSVQVVVQDKERMNVEIDKTAAFMVELSQSPELMEKFKRFKEQWQK